MTTETVLPEFQIDNLSAGIYGRSRPARIDFARAIEQAVLQSEQVQAWKKDAERYRWWCDTGNDISSGDTFGGKTTIDAAIDAAMKEQK